MKIGKIEITKIPYNKFKLDWETYADYPEKGLIYDVECVKYALAHMSTWQKLDPMKVGMAALASQYIKFGLFDGELPPEPWQFEF